MHVRVAVQVSPLPVQLPDKGSWQIGNSSSAWVLATHVDLDGIPGTWFWPGPAQVANIWGISQSIEAGSVSNSAFHMMLLGGVVDRAGTQGGTSSLLPALFPSAVGADSTMSCFSRQENDL